MPDNEPLLDHAYLRDNYLSVGFGDLLRDVLVTMRQQAVVYLSAAQDALKHQNRSALAETAHALKGSAGSVGASQLAATAERLEMAAPTENLAALSRRVAELALVTARTDRAFATELERPADDGWLDLL